MKDGIINLDTLEAKELGFTSDKFEGYLWYFSKDNKVIISMIYSLHPGKGNFLSLVNTLKSRFNIIEIPCPSNKMRLIAGRLGFRDVMLDNEIGPTEGLIWIK